MALRSLILGSVVLAGTVGCEQDPPLGYVYSPSGLSLREAPSLEGQVIAVLPFGAPLAIEDSDTLGTVVIDSIPGRWLAVRSGLQRGYVFDGYVTEYPPPDSAGLLPEGSLAQKAFVFGANLVSLRDHPSRSSGPLAYISYRDSVQVLLAGLPEAPDSLEGVHGSWVRVRWRGIEGFLFDAYLSQFRPLERRFSTGGRNLVTEFVQGADRVVLRAAPDSAADPVGELGYGDSVSVLGLGEGDVQSYQGLPGVWVYARSRANEGFLFDAFLARTPPPASDSAGPAPVSRPRLRYVVATPGVRIWAQDDERIFTQQFAHYGDSVLVLFGGRESTRTGPEGRLRRLVHVKRRGGEGLMDRGALSTLPAPEIGTPFREFMSETIGRTDTAETSEAPRAGRVVRYNRGVTSRSVEQEDGTARLEFTLPGERITGAFALLKACRENEYFAGDPPLPESDAHSGDYEVTLRRGPGGTVVGIYVVDVRTRELIAIDRDADATTIGFGRAPQEPAESEAGDSASVPGAGGDHSLGLDDTGDGAVAVRLRETT